MQIDKSEFQELLKEVKLYNKLDLAAQAIQTKYAKDMAGEDHEQRLAAQKETNEILKGILAALGGTKSKSGGSVQKPKAVSNTSFSLKDAIKDDLKLFKEELKAGFGFAKDAFSGIKNVFKSKAAPEIDNPNIVDTADEIIADETKKQSNIFQQMLDTFEESLDQLKAIRNSLEGGPEPLKRGTPSGLASASPAAAGAGGGGLLGPDGLPIPPVIPSLPSKPGPVPPQTPPKTPPKTPPAKPGLGSRILGGAAKVGRFAMMGLAAKPMLIGAAIAGTAYAGYKGYQYLKGKEQKLGEEVSTPGYDAATEQMAGGAVDPSSLPPPPAPATSAPSTPTPTPAPKPVEAPASKPTMGAAIAATVTAPSTTKKSDGVSSDVGDANLQELQMAQGGLQELYGEMRDKKAKVMESLIRDKKRFPDGIIDDPSDPEYPEELKAIDDKYKKLIDNQKKEIEKLSRAPGIKEAKARAKAEDDRFFGDEEDVAPVRTRSKTTGETVSTTSSETVTGGGSTTTKRVLSEDAQKAEKELEDLNKKQQSEKVEAFKKLEAQGLSRRERINAPEIKELNAKQAAERAAVSKRIDEGTSYQVTKISGENAAMRDEMSTTTGSQPVIMNNVSSNNTTSYVPMRGEPRATQRGSSLDRYSDRVAAY